MTILHTLSIIFIGPTIVLFVFFIILGKENKIALSFKEPKVLLYMYFALAALTAFITLPLYFINLNYEKQSSACEAKQGIYLKQKDRCVKADIYKQYKSIESTIKLD